MNAKEEQELKLKANTGIIRYGDTPEVRKFLTACGLNLGIMMANQEEGDMNDPEMEFEINGVTLCLTLA